MGEYTTVGSLARDMGEKTGAAVRPSDITNLFYKRILDEDRCPVLGGRRLIPVDYVPVIERVLRERGLIRDHAPEGEW